MELAIFMIVLWVLVATVLLLRLAGRSPFGFEDSSGFHYGEPARRE